MITFLLFTLQVFANESLLWELTDTRYHKEQLCEAYVDGEEYLFQRESCTRLGCDKWKYTIKTFCKNDTAALEYWKQGSVFSYESISKEQWLQHRGNLLRSRAAFHASYGKNLSLVDGKEDLENKLHINYEVSDTNSKIIEKGTWILGNGPSIPMTLVRKSIKKQLFEEINTDTFLQQLK